MKTGDWWQKYLPKLEGDSANKFMTNSKFSGNGRMLQNTNKIVSSQAFLTEELKSCNEKKDERQDLDENKIDVAYGYESIPDVDHRFEAPSPITDRFGLPI